MKEQPELKVVEVETDSLVPYANNAKLHSELQVDQIANSIKEFGFNDPIAVWENGDGELEIVEGHGRVLAAKKLKIDTLPVVYLNHLSDEQRRAYTHVHNQTTLNSGFDFEILELDMEELDFNWEDFGFELSAEEYELTDPEDHESLADRFGIPPFTVLNSRDGKWQERKRQWMNTGIRSELGRDDGLAYQPGLLDKGKKYKNRKSQS